VVTGAASGIGRSVAIRLAGEGARLVLTDLRDEGLQATARDCRVSGATVLVAEAFDLTDHEAVTAFGERGPATRPGAAPTCSSTACGGPWSRSTSWARST